MADSIVAQQPAQSLPPGAHTLDAQSSKLRVLYLTGGMGLPHYIAYHELERGQAERLYRKVKSQGRTVWMETTTGEHHAMPGSKKSPAKHYERFARCIVL